MFDQSPVFRRHQYPVVADLMALILVERFALTAFIGRAHIFAQCMPWNKM